MDFSKIQEYLNYESKPDTDQLVESNDLVEDEKKQYLDSLNAIIGTIRSLKTNNKKVIVSDTENAAYNISINSKNYICAVYMRKYNLSLLTNERLDDIINDYVTDYVNLINAGYKYIVDNNSYKTIFDKLFVEEFLLLHEDKTIFKILSLLDKKIINIIMMAIIRECTGQFNIICRLNGHRILLRYYKPYIKWFNEFFPNESITTYINLLKVSNLNRNYKTTDNADYRFEIINKGMNIFSCKTAINKYCSFVYDKKAENQSTKYARYSYLDYDVFTNRGKKIDEHNQRELNKCKNYKKTVSY